jgi:hypothetical protein
MHTTRVHDARQRLQDALQLLQEYSDFPTARASGEAHFAKSSCLVFVLFVQQVATKRQEAR